MAKKNTTNLDDFDFDDDIFSDFGDSSEDGNSKQPKRGPIRTLSTSFAEGARDALTEPSKIKELTRHALPKSYSSAFDAADAVSNSARQLYDTAAAELKPIMPMMRKAAGKLVEKSDGLLPKGLRGKLKDFAERSDNGYRIPTQEESDNSQISEELGSIFKETAEADAKRSATDRAERYLRYRVQDRQSTALIGELARLNDSQGRLVAYQDSVTYKYQQKTLENSYRQTFMLRDILKTHKETHELMREGLKTLIHNTALPDFQKKGVGDSARESMRDRLLSGAQNQAQKFAGGFFKQITDGLQDRLKGALGSLTGLAEMVEDGKDAMDQAAEIGMEDGGKLGMVGTGLGGIVADWASTQAMVPLRKLLEKSRRVKGGGEASTYALSQVPAYLMKLKRQGVDDITTLRGSGMQALLDLLPDLDKKKNVGGSAIFKADTPVPFDNMTRRSIVEIIPGFLSRILHEVSNIRGGLGFELKSDRIVFNPNANKFDTVKGTTADTKKVLFHENELFNIQKHANAMVDQIDDGKMTARQRKLMAERFLKGADDLEYIDADLFSKDRLGKGLPEKDRAALERAYRRAMLDSSGKFNYEKGNALVKANTDLQTSATDMLDRIKMYADSGGLEHLRDLGVVQANGFSTDLNFDTIRKLRIDGPGVEKKLDPEKKGFFEQKLKSYSEGWEKKSEEIADKIAGNETYQAVTAGIGDAVDNVMDRLFKFAKRFGDGEGDLDDLASEFESPTPMSEPTSGRPSRRTGRKTKSAKGTGKGKKRRASLLRSERSASVSGAVEDYEPASKPKFRAGHLSQNRHFRGKPSLSLDDLQDIYTDSGIGAAITTAGIRAGQYRDQLTGKVITSLKDIRGPVVDAAGNVVATTDQVLRGLYNDAGEKLSGISERAASHIRNLYSAATRQQAAMGAGGPPPITPTAAAAGASSPPDPQATPTAESPSDQYLRMIAELNENQLALLDQIYQTMTQFNFSGGGGGPAQPGTAPLQTPGFMKRYFGHAGGVIAGAGKGAWGLTKGTGRYLKGAFKLQWAGLKFGARSAFGAVSGGVSGAWNLLSPSARRARRQSDVYVKGNMQTPVLFKKLMAEGVYQDVTTGKVIYRVDDIHGAVKNLRTGNIDLTQEEYDNGITDNVGANIGTAIKKAIMGVGAAFAGYSGSVLALPFKIGQQAMRFAGKSLELINEGQDVYLKGRLARPVMLNKDIKAGKFFSAKTGRRIKSYRDVDGEIYYFDPATKEKRIAITQEEADTLPLVNWRGKPLRTLGQRGMGLLGSAVGLAADSAMGLAKGYAKVVGSVMGMGRDMIVGTAKGIGRFFNPNGRFGKVAVDADARQIRLLEDIFGVLMDRLPVPKKLRKGSWQEQFDARSAAEAGKEKDGTETAKGGLFGGLKDLFAKGKKGLLGLFGLGDDDEEDEDDDDGSLLDDAADGLDVADDLSDINERRRRGKRRKAAKKRLKRMRRGRGKAGRLSRLFGRGGRAAAVAGEGAELAGAAGRSAGAARGLLGVGGKAIPIAGAALATGLGAKELYDIQHDNQMGAYQKKVASGGAIGGTGGALAGAAAGAMIGTAVAGPIGTVVGGAIGGFAGSSAGSWVGKKIAQNPERAKLAAVMAMPTLLPAFAMAKVHKQLGLRKDDPFRTLRMAQYGFTMKDTDKIDKLQQLEDICSDVVMYTPQGPQLDQAKLDPDVIFSLFDIDDGGFLGFFKKDNASKRDGFLQWFNVRFKPTYLAWKAAVKSAVGSKAVDLSEAWEKTNAQERKAILPRTKVSDSIYSVQYTPFSDQPDAGPADVAAAYKDAEQRIEKEIGSAQQKSKIAGIVGERAGKIANVLESGTKFLPLPLALLNKAAIKALRKVEANAGQIQANAAPPEQGGFKAGMQLTAMQSIRYKAYGLKVMQTDRVNALAIMERLVLKDISFTGQTTASYTKSANEAYSQFAQYFGLAVDDEGRRKDWKDWFEARFLPAFLMFLSSVKAYTNTANIDLSTVEKSLKSDQLIAVARAVIAAQRKHLLVLKTSIWSYTTSPWDGEDNLNDDINTTVANMERLSQQAQDSKLQEETAQKKPPVDPKASKPEASAKQPTPAKTPTQSPSVSTEKAATPAWMQAGTGPARDLEREQDAAYWAAKGINPGDIAMVDGRMQSPAKLANGAKIDGINADALWKKVSPLIASGESMGGNYEAQNGVRGNVQPGLTKMTIGDVYNNSKAIGASDGGGPKTGAAGKYQFIPKTLLAVAKMAGLKLTDLFSAENQEKMGRAIFDNRVMRGLKNGVTGILDQLAMEWASLPSPSKGGASWYAGVAGNRAHGGMRRLQELVAAVTDTFSSGGGEGGGGGGGSVVPDTKPTLPTAVKPKVTPTGPQETAKGGFFSDLGSAIGQRYRDTVAGAKLLASDAMTAPGAAASRVSAAATERYSATVAGGKQLLSDATAMPRNVANAAGTAISDRYNATIAGGRQLLRDVAGAASGAASSVARAASDVADGFAVAAKPDTSKSSGSAGVGSAKAAKVAAFCTSKASAGSRGICARAVADGLQACGFKFDRQPSAYMYAANGVLESLGWTRVDPQSQPKIGDIIVFERSDRHPHGHIQIFNGTQWVSDFKQRSIIPWRNKSLANIPPCTMWRDSGTGAAGVSETTSATGDVSASGGTAASLPPPSANIATPQGLQNVQLATDAGPQGDAGRDAQVQQMNRQDAYVRSMDQQRDRLSGDANTRMMEQALDVATRHLETSQEISEKMTRLIDAVENIKIPEVSAAPSPEAGDSSKKKTEPASRLRPGFEQQPSRSPLNVTRGVLRRA